MECSICNKKILPLKHKGKVVWKDGNNAEPINKGRCCDSCNLSVVVPKRVSIMMMEDKEDGV